MHSIYITIFLMLVSEGVFAASSRTELGGSANSGKTAESTSSSKVGACVSYEDGLYRRTTVKGEDMSVVERIVALNPASGCPKVRDEEKLKKAYDKWEANRLRPNPERMELGEYQGEKLFMEKDFAITNDTDRSGEWEQEVRVSPTKKCTLSAHVEAHSTFRIKAGTFVYHDLPFFNSMARGKKVDIYNAEDKTKLLRMTCKVLVTKLVYDRFKSQYVDFASWEDASAKTLDLEDIHTALGAVYPQ